MIFSLLSQRYPEVQVTFTGHLCSTKFKELLLPVAVAYLIAPCIGEPSPYLRQECCRLLGEMTLALEDPPVMALALLTKGPINDLPWSYCGSFVIALEDEFQAVRLATVESIGKLATRTITFAEQCLNSLVDCFQDEMERVKIKAMTVLQAIYQQYGLKAQVPHFEAILAHLDDTVDTSRRAIRNVFGSVTLSQEDDLLPKTIRCCQLAIAKYRNEASFYMKSISDFALLNSSLIMAQASKLLKIDKFFLTAEPKIEDISYQVRLMLVLVALSRHHDQIDILPKSLLRHYHYLRAKYPEAMVDFRGGELHDQFYCVPLKNELIKVNEKFKKQILQDVKRYLLEKSGSLEQLTEQLRYQANQVGVDFIDFCLRILNNPQTEWRRIIWEYDDPTEFLRPFLDNISSTEDSLVTIIPYNLKLKRIQGEVRVYGLGSQPSCPIIFTKENDVPIVLKMLLNILPSKRDAIIRIFHQKGSITYSIDLEDVYYTLYLTLNKEFLSLLNQPNLALLVELVRGSGDEQVIIASTSIYIAQSAV